MSGQLTTADRVPATARIAVPGSLDRRTVAAVSALGVLTLFLVYYRLSWTVPVGSDGAANVLQAWDMLHGNVLLHGWWLADVSFYTTELPQYALLEAVLGPVPAVVHVAGAMTYTLVVLLAAILAKGRATGREGLLRMLIAAGIMLAPQPGGGVDLLDRSPDHIGTSVPLLVTWLVIDRAGRRPWVPAAVGLLLAWALVADPLVLYAGIVPVAVVCSVRAYRSVVAGRQPGSSARFEIALALAALAAIPVAASAVTVIHTHGGFTDYPIRGVLATEGTLPAHLSATFASVLTLFGANFLGLRVGLTAAGAFLHLTGVALAASAVWLGLRRLARRTGPDGLAVEVMTVAVCANLVAFVFSTVPATSGRDIAVVLPFSAALAGRLLAGWVVSARLLPALAVVLLGYVFTLAHGTVLPSQPTEGRQIATWLAARHLRYGLGGYWQANSVTLASGQRVQIRAVTPGQRGMVGPYPWESRPSWYDHKLHDANFVVLDTPRSSERWSPYGAVLATFGNPARTYRVGPYLVLVWHKNLLTGMGCGKPGGRAVQIGISWGAPRCW